MLSAPPQLCDANHPSKLKYSREMDITIPYVYVRTYKGMKWYDICIKEEKNLVSIGFRPTFITYFLSPFIWKHVDSLIRNFKKKI